MTSSIFDSKYFRITTLALLLPLLIAMFVFIVINCGFNPMDDLFMLKAFGYYLMLAIFGCAGDAFLQECAGSAIDSSEDESFDILPGAHRPPGDPRIHNTSRNLSKIERQQALEEILSFKYVTDKNLHDWREKHRDSSGMNDDSALCSICIDKYAIGDKYVMFNGCQHFFHFECILHWFERHSECPICRKQVVNEKKIRQVARSIRISNRSSVLTNAGSENV
mmetsp:Transcript_44307/g.86967  ORF Transcript_44307/g.86967 Transcript_44307/m.86967 type:complete len:222 (-) Transcript_44307:158-823(-)